jgi:hypothetical protein
MIFDKKIELKVHVNQLDFVSDIQTHRINEFHNYYYTLISGDLMLNLATISSRV